MIRKTFSLALSVAALVGVALLAPSADAPKIPKYELVAGWPKLPDGAKLGGVTAVAVDAKDQVYLFHRGKQTIMVFDAEGKFVRSFGDGLVKTAHGLRIDPAGSLWITDIGNHLVTKLDPEGKVLLTLGKKDDPGDTPDKFNKPTDVAVTPGGDFYVSDGYGNSRVVKFAKDGKYLKEWGKKGTGPGEFNLPHAVCLDAKGQVYVGDRENNRVQVFDPDGKFLAQWKESGAPYGLDLTPKWMLVADGRGNQVRILDRDGKPLDHWGEKGKDPGQFLMPHWIAIDSKGSIYVAEVTGTRVQKFVAK